MPPSAHCRQAQQEYRSSTTLVARVTVVVVVRASIVSRSQAHLQAPAPKARNGDVFDSRFQLAAEDWLDFLQRDAATRVYAKGEATLRQLTRSPSPSLSLSLTPTLTLTPSLTLTLSLSLPLTR